MDYYDRKNRRNSEDMDKVIHIIHLTISKVKEVFKWLVG